MNHTQLTLDYMVKHGSITNSDAVLEHGNYRLSETILYLRSKGYNIETVIEHGYNRYGRPTRYGRYYLREAI